MQFSNYHPVSNVTFISKAIIEKTVVNQLISYMNTNNLYETFQSVYKQYYSTESALICVHDDILTTIDNRRKVITSWPLCSFRYGWSRYSPFLSTRALWSYWQALIMVSILSVQSHAVCVCWRWGFLETCSLMWCSTRFSFGTHFVPS